MSVVQEDFDRIALVSTHEHWTHNGHYHNFLLRHLPAVCETALEIGCGAGEFSRRLAARSRQVVALDLSPEMIRVARSRSAQFSNIDFRVADVISWEFPKTAFDCIASIATLHHLPLPQLLSQTRESLKPGGVLLILDLFEPERNIFTPDGAIDFALDASARPVSVGLRLIYDGRVFPAREVRAAWAAHEQHDSYLTIKQVREICSDLLPGAQIRRHLLWRYSVVWRKSG